MHHTKVKGDIAVAKVVYEFTKAGYFVFTPTSEHCPFDLIIYKDYKLIRLQVKYRETKDGKITLNFRSCWADKNGTHNVQINKADVDYWCVYCPDTDKCYFVDVNKYNRGITIRVADSKSPGTNQYGYNFAEDFESLP